MSRPSSPSPNHRVTAACKPPPPPSSLRRVLNLSTQMPPLFSPLHSRPNLRKTSSWTGSSSLPLRRKDGRSSGGGAPRLPPRPPSRRWCDGKPMRPWTRSVQTPPSAASPFGLNGGRLSGGGASSPLPSRQAEEWQVVQHCKHWRRITCRPAARSHLTWWVIASTAFASTMSSSHAPSPLAVCVATVEAIRPAHVSVQDRRMQRGRRSASQGSPKWSF
jgi:hypothetical protein